MKIINNRDGSSGNRWTTYESYSPCSYNIVSTLGETVGNIHQIKDFYGTKWVATTLKNTFTHIYLKEVRKVVLSW